MREAPLWVAAGPYARHRAVDGLRALTRDGVLVAAFDDPDWQTTWDLHGARRLADQGAIVLVTVPAERLLGVAATCGQLDPEAGVADLVLSVQHDRLTATGEFEADTQPGVAVLSVVRNRRGPRHPVELLL